GRTGHGRDIGVIVGDDSHHTGRSPKIGSTETGSLQRDVLLCASASPNSCKEVEFPMRIAFVGPPQSGKSTLFRAVTGHAGGPQHAPGEQLAVVKVPDKRLDYLADLYKPKKYTEATMDCL